jgi:hypothetical protein
MASGFQNNQSQLTPNYYRVVLTLSTSNYSTTASSNASGGVEPLDFTNFNTMNTTTDYSRRRARGNIRFNSILNYLQMFDNVQIVDMTVLTGSPPSAAETASDDIATQVSFTVGYTQEAYVLGGWQQLIKNNTLSDGSTTLTTTSYDQLSASDAQTAMQNSIKESITRGITIGGSSGYTRRYKIYNVDSSDHREEDITVTQPRTPADVWGNVSVTLIDTMTQQNF